MTGMELNVKGLCMYMYAYDFTWYGEKNHSQLPQKEVWVVSPRDDSILFLNRDGAV